MSSLGDDYYRGNLDICITNISIDICRSIYYFMDTKNLSLIRIENPTGLVELRECTKNFRAFVKNAQDPAVKLRGGVLKLSELSEAFERLPKSLIDGTA